MMRRNNGIPLVVEVKRHSLHDGPGIRSVVFFKGCPLRCVFCQNPETQNAGREIAFSAARCIQCKQCEINCPEHAVDMKYSGRIHRALCSGCGACADVCPSGSLRAIGSCYAIEELSDVLLRDEPFYRQSGGGVTLSGGECTMYPEYAGKLCRTLKNRNLHILIETCGFFDYQAVEELVLPYTDAIYYDVKIADPKMHELYTGVSNSLILDNLQRLIRLDAEKILVRIPLIPAITATIENIGAIVDIIHSYGCKTVALVPYNPMGNGMAQQLGRSPSGMESKFMDVHDEQDLYAKFCEMVREKMALAPPAANVG